MGSAKDLVRALLQSCLYTKHVLADFFASVPSTPVALTISRVLEQFVGHGLRDEDVLGHRLLVDEALQHLVHLALGVQLERRVEGARQVELSRHAVLRDRRRGWVQLCAEKLGTDPMQVLDGSLGM